MSTRGASKRTRATPDRVRIEERRARVVEHLKRGLTQQEIADLLTAQGDPISQKQISRDLAAMRDEWQKLRAEGLDRVRAIQFYRLEAISRAAWDGWDRSLRDEEQTQTTVHPRAKKGSAGAEQGMVRVTRRGQTGDPRFLKVALEAADKILKLFGAYPQPEDGAGTERDEDPTAPGFERHADVVYLPMDKTEAAS